MAFELYKSDHGAVAPLEYLPAAAGTYVPGQLLAVKDGKLAAIEAEETGVPPYICHAAKTIEEAEGADDVLPVNRISHDAVYKATLEGAEAGAKMGVAMQIKTGGLSPTGEGGSFELVYVDGTAAGDYVLGRFVHQAAASEAV